MASRGFAKTSFRLGGPVLVLALLLILLRLPFVTSGPGPYLPDVGLIYVYYFTLYRPTVAPLWLVLIVGLFVDVLDSMPLGSSALIFLLVSAFLHSQRRFFINRSFGVTWAGFSILALGAKFLQWAVLSLIKGDMLSPSTMVTELLMTVLTFPILGWIFGRYDRMLLR